MSVTVRNEAITVITADIRSSVEEYAISVGAPEAAQIQADTTSYETAVAGSASTLRNATADYVAGVHAQIASCKAKEARIAALIEQKKQELLRHGIRLDMPFIQKLASDEARAKENVKNLRTWI